MGGLARKPSVRIDTTARGEDEVKGTSEGRGTRHFLLGYLRDLAFPQDTGEL